MRYLPFELHCHTKHSDGDFTVPELFEAAAAYGYAGLALTDHNAVTGCAEATEQLQKRTCMLIPGIEWTTFYGHLLVLGCDRFVDWRFVEPDTIDEALAEIRAAGGVAGIAHPCETGAPLMCGCNWEFHVARWDLVDYMEIWSNPDPHARTKNQLAMPLYDGLLNAGHHLAVTAGRDWHGPDEPGQTPLLTATYLGIDGPLTYKSALAAIRAGRTYVTMGPTVSVTAEQDGAGYGLGQTVPAGPMRVRVDVGETERRDVWGVNDIHTTGVRLVTNASAVEQPCAGGPITFEAAPEKGWLRVELLGRYAGREGVLAITSPLYVA